MRLKAPFPYFGGKSSVAETVWRALGEVDHYLEPFFGSGAVLLARKNWQGKTETVNDKDGFVANVWRAIKFDPGEVVRWCDWPVNHADLAARKKELIKNEERLLENLIADPEWFDAKMAGYWVWAASCWIGSGLTRTGAIPHLSAKGMGIHAVGQIPHLSHKGKGIHGKGASMRAWLQALADRLRDVRVVCGDWTRVCGGDWQDKAWPTVGIFFDPPYGVSDRDDVYHHDDKSEVAQAVMAWAQERGARDNYRIVLAGYEEYQDLVDSHGWRKMGWKTRGGYGSASKVSRGRDNARRETLYFSPNCLDHQEHPELFEI